MAVLVSGLFAGGPGLIRAFNLFLILRGAFIRSGDSEGKGENNPTKLKIKMNLLQSQAFKMKIT